ncbi:MAG: hypothetical protein U0641_05695 [Anaerolineae bacterium]
MTATEAFERLKGLVQAETDPVLTDGEVQGELDANKVADGDGNPPSSFSWTPTFLLYRAAANLWEQKAAKATGYVTVQGDGTTINSEMVYDHCLKMAKSFRRRVSVSVSIPMQDKQKFTTLPAPPSVLGDPSYEGTTGVTEPGDYPGNSGNSSNSGYPTTE